jgi:endogenous inhibitor of DNA gyrase (YacG/DUF329 family)
MLCPTCSQPTTWEGNTWRPFCSERCQVTDLGTWAAEQYRIPGPPLTTDTGIPESTDDGKANDCT